MATWPTTLQINRSDYNETPPNNTLRTQMGAGPAKLRKRTSSNVRTVKFKMFLTDAEVSTLDAFFTTNEAFQFDFTDLRTNSAVKARFTTPPQYRLKDTMWDVSVELEILP